MIPYAEELQETIRDLRAEVDQLRKELVKVCQAVLDECGKKIQARDDRFRLNDEVDQLRADRKALMSQMATLIRVASGLSIAHAAAICDEGEDDDILSTAAQCSIARALLARMKEKT